MTEQIVMSTEKPDERAVALYRWEWGEEGACTQLEQFMLQQLAGNLGRSIIFSPLPAPPPTLGVDERTQLIARSMSLDIELTEVRKQFHILYDETEKLRSDNRILAAREMGAKQALEGAVDERERALDQWALMGSELAEAKSELSRLRSMLGGAVGQRPPFPDLDLDEQGETRVE